MLKGLGGGAGEKAGGEKKAPLARANLVLRFSSLISRKEQRLPPIFVGFDAEGVECRVALATAREAAVWKSKDGETLDAAAERLETTYTGSGDKRRPNLAQLVEADGKFETSVGGLVGFTDAVKGDDGVWRAHWMEGLESKPGASVVDGLLCVRPSTGESGKRWRCEVFFPKRAAILAADNVEAELQGALNPVDGEGALRRPMAMIRLLDEAGAILAQTTFSAQYEKKDVSGEFDTTPREVFLPLPADVSAAHLFNPENTAENAAMARVMLFALMQKEGYPDFKSGQLSAAKQEEVRGVVDQIRAGALRVELLPGVNFPAGPSTNTELTARAEKNKYHPVHHFLQKVRGGGENDKSAPTYCFAPGSVVVNRGKDGLPFMTKWIMESPTVRYMPPSKLATVNDAVAGAEAAARAQEAAAPDALGALDADEAVDLAAQKADNTLGNEP